MVFVLVALCAVLSVITYSEQFPGGSAGGAALARDVIDKTPDRHRS